MAKQSGFAVIELLLSLVVLSIIGFTGYYVWHAQKNTDKTLDQTVNPQLATKKSEKVQQITFSRLPLALKEVAVKQAPDCYNQAGVPLTEDGSTDTAANVYYIDDRAAIFGSCNAVSIFAYQKGSWFHVTTGQDSPSCVDL